MRYSAGILLLVVLLAPGVGAQASQQSFNTALWGEGAVGSMEMYLVDGFTDHRVGTFTQEVFAARLDTRDRIANGTWVFIITAMYVIEQNGNGVWEWQVSLDGTDVEGCRWVLQTINTNSGINAARSNEYPNMQVVCRHPEPAFGPHDVTITRTALSGSPAAVSTAVTSVNILNNDPVILSMPSNFEALTGLSALEFLIFPAMAIAGLFLWSRQDLGVRLFGIFLVAFDLALIFSFFANSSGNAWEALLVMVFILLLAMAWMVIQLARDIGRERREAT